MNRRWRGWWVLALIAASGIALVSYRAASSGTTAAPANASAKPVRIASITLVSDELLAQLVPPERVVCVTYLADDAEISNVAGFYPPQIPRLREADLERIIALTADLVCVAPYNSADFLKLIERSGIPVYRNEAYHSIDQIETGIEELGRRVGEAKQAAQVVAEMQTRRKRLAQQLADLPRRPKVLYWTAGFTSGRTTTTDDIIREAGGINMAAELGLVGPVEISPEQVIAADPEYILLGRWSADAAASRIENHPLLRTLPAVREKRCLVIEGRYLSTVSQHVVAGAEQLARQLHPDRFRPTNSASPKGATR